MLVLERQSVDGKYYVDARVDKGLTHYLVVYSRKEKGETPCMGIVAPRRVNSGSDYYTVVYVRVMKH